jgi:FPC/CPF motif-containing protein YcgG
MNKLYIDDNNDRELLPWEREALHEFKKKMTNKENPFPCIPATQGHSLGQFRYGFVGDPRRDSSTTEVAHLLSAYTTCSRSLGNYTSLIIFFNTPKELASSYTVEKFEELFWKKLNGLHELDDMEWPSHIPMDPHNPLWEFCYNQEQYFMYCGTPSHSNRKSRNFPYYMLAITPRWVLENFNASPTFAKKIKERIRKRLVNYDNIDIHPDLNSYGNENNYEWKQYYLRDDDTALSKCPFQKFLGVMGYKK